MDYSRQKDAFQVETFNKQVHIIGVGATGSWVALMLTKMGITPHIWDFDTVEEHNIPNQLFGIDDIGEKKADAVARKCIENNGKNPIVHNQKVSGAERLSGIVFVLTDTMHSRKDIFEKALMFKPNIDLLIETRMGLDGGFIYVVEPNNPIHIEKYKETLYSDEEAAVSVCGTSQSLVATALEISSIAVWQLINRHNGKITSNVISVSTEFNTVFGENW